MIQILKYGQVEKEKIFSRVVPEMNVEAIVAEIIENVKNKGDEALFAYTEKFDKAKLTSLAVTREEIEEAFNSVSPEFVAILEKAAKNRNDQVR